MASLCVHTFRGVSLRLTRQVIRLQKTPPPLAGMV